MELTQFTKMSGQQAALAGVPRTFDELHDGAGKAMRNAPHDHAESRGGFPLARARMDDDESLLAALGGHHPVAGGLLLRHFSRMAGIKRSLGGNSFLLSGIRFGNHLHVPLA